MTGVLNIGRWIERWSILYFLKSSVCDKNVRATSKQILCICRHTHEQRKQRQKNGKRPIRPKKEGGRVNSITFIPEFRARLMVRDKLF